MRADEQRKCRRNDEKENAGQTGITLVVCFSSPSLWFAICTARAPRSDDLLVFCLCDQSVLRPIFRNCAKERENPILCLSQVATQRLPPSLCFTHGTPSLYFAFVTRNARSSSTENLSVSILHSSSNYMLVRPFDVLVECECPFTLLLYSN